MKRTHGLAGLAVAALGMALAGCGGGSSQGTPNFVGQRLLGLTATGRVVEFGAGNSQFTSTQRTIRGLQSGERILGLDYRPANGQLYALGSSSRLYTVDLNTNLATAVGGPFSTLLEGTRFGFDFNPTVDRIRVVSDTDQNLCLNPDTGAVTVDADVNYTTGGANPSVTGVAYTNSVAGATTTTLYGIDTQADTLVRFTSPNDGTLATVGLIGNLDAESAFEIVPDSNDALAILRRNNVTGLYRIDLTTGAATLINRVGSGSEQFTGLAARTTTGQQG